MFASGPRQLSLIWYFERISDLFCLLVFFCLLVIPKVAEQKLADNFHHRLTLCSP